MAKLEANRPVLELASSPLLLTLLCLVFQERNDFDGTRAELYGEGLDILLRKWDAKRGVERDRPYGLSITNMETLLGEIAYSRFMASEYFFDQGSLEKQIEGFFTERKLLSPHQELLPARVLNSIESHLGLLVQRAVRVYSFSHLTFQEYLSAQRVAKKRTLLAEIGPHVGERRWREVWLLLVTLLDEDDIIPELKKCVDMLVQKEPKIQKYLVWCRRKAVAQPGDYKMPALRAYFFGLDRAVERALGLDRALGVDRARFGSGRTLASDLDLDRALERALKLDLDLALALDRALADVRALDDALALDRALALALAVARALDHALALDIVGNTPLRIAHDVARDVARALARALNRAADVAFVAAPALIPELQTLRAEVSTAPERMRWREKWPASHARFRAAAIQHRNIGHDWKFTARQTELLDDFYRANLLQVECMKAARGLTNKTRQHIGDTMLLPWNELPSG